MASRLCCAEDHRPESPPLPNARPSPMRTRQPVRSASFAPLSVEMRPHDLRVLNVDGMKVTFGNETMNRNHPNPSTMDNLQDLYVLPRKAPLPPQPSAGQQLRRKFSIKSTNSSLTVLNVAKRKIQNTKESIQLLPSTLQRKPMLETPVSDKDAEERTHSRDTVEVVNSQGPTSKSDQRTPTLANGGNPRRNHHRSVMRSFEWMSPLFDGHHTINSRGSPTPVAAKSSDSRLLSSSRLSASSPGLLNASTRNEHDYRHSPAQSLQSKSAVHVQKPVSGTPSEAHHHHLQHGLEGTMSDGSNAPHKMAYDCEKNVREMKPADRQHLCDSRHHGRASRELNSGSPRVHSMVTSFSDSLNPILLVDEMEKTPDYDFLHKDVNGLPLIRCTSRESVAASLHLQNMQISQRLRSSSNVSDSVSLLTRRTNNRKSQNSHTPSNLAYTTGMQLDSSSNHHMASSGFISAKTPGSWGLTHRDAASSVYSSRLENDLTSPMPYASCFPDPLSLWPRTPAVKSPSFATAPSHADTHSQTGDNDQRDDPQRDGSLAKLSPAISNAAGSPIVKQAQRSQASSSNLSRTSKFVEDIDALSNSPKQECMTQQSVVRRKYSTFNLFHFPRSGARQIRNKILSYDGPSDQPTDELDQAPRSSIPLLPNHDEAAEMWERALKAHADEKAAMWLKPNDHYGDLVSKRERRHSNSRSRTSSNAHSSHHTAAFHTPALDPIDIDPFESSSGRPSITQNHLAPPLPTYVTQEQRRAISHTALPETQDLETHSIDHSAWCRYPSHTRPQRSGSAGPDDNVFPRDFVTPTSEHIRAEQNAFTWRGINSDTKRFKKRFSFGSRSGPSGSSYKRIKSRLPRSQSMTFGRKIIKHYASFFKPQSYEFFHYGHGHRGSVSTGGALENPELEILRPVLPTFPESSAEASVGQGERGFEWPTTHQKRKAKAVDGSCEIVSLGSRIDQKSSAGNPAQGNAIRSPICTPPEKSSSSNLNGTNDDFFSDLADSVQFPDYFNSGRKRKRRLLSSHSEPIVDSKTSLRITSIASAWNKVYEDCVHNPLRSHYSSHKDMVAEEPTEPIGDHTAAASYNIGESRSVKTTHYKSSHADPIDTNMSVARSTPDSLPMEETVKLLQPASTQSLLFSPLTMHAEFNTHRDRTAKSQAKSPTLSSSASAPLLGTSEASFLEALKRNECIERERVLRQAEELIT